MAGHFPITALAWLFGAVTVAAPLAVTYRFRRKPIVALIAIADRRAAFHRDALAALDSAIAAARSEGNTSEAERLAANREQHVRALRSFAAAQEFAGER